MFSCSWWLFPMVYPFPYSLPVRIPVCIFQLDFPVCGMETRRRKRDLLCTNPGAWGSFVVFSSAPGELQRFWMLGEIQGENASNVEKRGIFTDLFLRKIWDDSGRNPGIKFLFSPSEAFFPPGFLPDSAQSFPRNRPVRSQRKFLCFPHLKHFFPLDFSQNQLRSLPRNRWKGEEFSVVLTALFPGKDWSWRSATHSHSVCN